MNSWKTKEPLKYLPVSPLVRPEVLTDLTIGKDNMERKNVKRYISKQALL